MIDIKKFFEEMSPNSLSELDQVYTADATFKDPFNELKGLESIRKVYAHMYEKLESPRFVIIDEVASGQSKFVSWDFLFSIKSKEMKIHGGTFFRFNEQGLITEHRDYWDVGEELLLKIPVFRSIYGLFRKQFKIKDVI